MQQDLGGGESWEGTCEELSDLIHTKSGQWASCYHQPSPKGSPPSPPHTHPPPQKTPTSGNRALPSRPGSYSVLRSAVTTPHLPSPSPPPQAPPPHNANPSSPPSQTHPTAAAAPSLHLTPGAQAPTVRCPLLSPTPPPKRPPSTPPPANLPQPHQWQPCPPQQVRLPQCAALDERQLPLVQLLQRQELGPRPVRQTHHLGLQRVD